MPRLRLESLSIYNFRHIQVLFFDPQILNLYPVILNYEFPFPLEPVIAKLFNSEWIFISTFVANNTTVVESLEILLRPLYCVIPLE